MCKDQSTLLNELSHKQRADWVIIVEQHLVNSSQQFGIIQVNYSVSLGRHGYLIVLLLDRNAVRNNCGVCDAPLIEMNIPHHLCGSWQ